MQLKRQSGLSLIELMIALLLGLIIVAAVIGLFIDSRQVYRTQDAKARLQENGRYAMHVLTRSIMNSAYLGCASRSGIDINNTLSAPWDFDTGLDIKTDSSVNTLRMFTVEEPTVNIINRDEAAKRFTLNSAQPFNVGDRVIVSNCERAAIFQVSAADDNYIEHTSDLQYPFNTGWINLVATKSFASDGTIEINNQAGELVEGLQSIDMLYGIDSNADGAANSYQNAAAVSDWQDVVSIQLTLTLVSSEQNLSVDPLSDGRLRSTFSKTITLRNRVP